jgi:uncharacterized membrane protein (UPF0127 family)
VSFDVNGESSMTNESSERKRDEKRTDDVARRARASFLMLCSALVASEVARADAPSKWALALLPSGAEFTVEVAADPESRGRGYMFREHVGPREGMLFVFDDVQHHSFWMKNCKVALDVIWLDEQFRVVDVAHERQPCPGAGPCPSVVPLRGARYVLEVRGGTARRESLAVGDRVAILWQSGTR